MPGIAFFDLDRTLTSQGTWSRFVRSAVPAASFWPKLPLVGATALAYKAGFTSRAAVKERAISLWLEGKARTELTDLAQAFVDHEMEHGLRPKARSVIDRHKADGHRLVIASAAVDLIVEPLAKALGFDDWICTRLDWTGDDTLKATLAGDNCYGAEKLRDVEAYMRTRPCDGERWFYSDHHTDLPCLLWADKGVAVNPSKRLIQLAHKHDLPIVDWGS